MTSSACQTPVAWGWPGCRVRAATWVVLGALWGGTAAWAEGGYALRFDGVDDHVTMGQAPGLGAPTFTIECWFQRTGPGVPFTSGAGGVVGVALICKGADEGDGQATDANYVLAIRAADGVLVADFEDSATGANHPVAGVTPIEEGTWHHAAATYDSRRWRLFLDGRLEAERTVYQVPRADSLQHFSLATAMNSTGSPSGRFEGMLDEVRVWDYARTPEEIRSAMNVEILRAPGLLGRWGFNEGGGMLADDSTGNGWYGSVVGASWTQGAPIAANAPPAAPIPLAPPDGVRLTGPTVRLSVSVSDPDPEPLRVTFYGRVLDGTEPAPFRVVALPDTQYYSAKWPQTFAAQTQWIVANRQPLNIVYVAHLGDIVDSASQPTQWANADAALSLLDLLTDLPYGLAVGNHDQSPNGDPRGTGAFNARFPYTRYAQRPWYGGHYGTDNDNHYVFFEGGGVQWLALHLEYGASADSHVLRWAGDVLRLHPDRPAVVVTHSLIGTGQPGAWNPQGAAVYETLRVHPNLVLMLCGHVSGEGRRADMYEGRTVHTLLADYQSRANGGEGWLRVLEFVPGENRVRVQTYSPTLDRYETDADSQFVLDLPMRTGDFAALGTVAVDAGAGQAAIEWSGLGLGRRYAWFAVVCDQWRTVTGPTRVFAVTNLLGDLDRDGDADMADFTRFQICFNGAGRPPTSPRDCAVADLDADGDVDLLDFSVFQVCFNGSGPPPACRW